MSSRRRGNQEPRLRVEPKRRFTDGDDASELASSYGLTPDPWQKLVLDAWLGRDQFDKFTATTCGLSVPRQNGKNAILEVFELYHLTCIGSAILHTAHEVKTARKSFLRLAGFFTNPNYPELTEMLINGDPRRGIRKTNGQEAIFLENGASIEFSARSKGSARGFTVDCVVFDEAAFLTDEQMEAIMSTMAAAPLGNRQLVYTGTPPSPSMPCEVFGNVRADAIRGDDRRLAWHEWSVERPPEGKPTFADVLDDCYETNPALGIRLDEDFTETEFHRLTADGFARERLGWWMSESQSALVSEDMWAACRTDEPPTGGRKAFGVKFSPDGSTVALAVALRPKKDEGPPHVEVVEYKSMREGTSWIAQFLLDAKSTTAVAVIDGRSHTDALIAQMREGGYPRLAIVVPKTGDVIASATRFYNAIKEKKVTHYGQAAFDDVAVKCKKRPIGQNGGWGWGGVGDADPTMMEAASLAYWGVMTTKRDPSRKMRVGVV